MEDRLVRRLSRTLANLNLRLHVPFETVPLGKTSRLMKPKGTEGTTALAQRPRLSESHGYLIRHPTKNCTIAISLQAPPRNIFPN